MVADNGAKMIIAFPSLFIRSLLAQPAEAFVPSKTISKNSDQAITTGLSVMMEVGDAMIKRKFKDKDRRR